MTDEEKADDYEMDCIADVYKDDVCTIPYAYSAQKIEKAYLDGLAEGRLENFNLASIAKKQRDDARKENAELKEKIEDFKKFVETLSENHENEIEQYKAQNEELKNMASKQVDSILELYDQIEKLTMQIESMKKTLTEISEYADEKTIHNIAQNELDKWEKAE